jgi:hypothetical protein
MVDRLSFYYNPYTFILLSMPLSTNNVARLHFDTLALPDREWIFRWEILKQVQDDMGWVYQWTINGSDIMALCEDPESMMDMLR